MALRIKDEYIGVILQSNNVIFNPYIVNKEHYINYMKYGFDYIFEEFEEEYVEEDKWKQVENYINESK